MIVTMSRQDLQGVVDYAKNRIIERLVTRNDVQMACDRAAGQVIDNLQDVRKANLPFIKQNIAITEQVYRRTQALDARIAGMEQDLKVLTQLMSRMVGQQIRTTNTFNSLQRY